MPTDADAMAVALADESVCIGPAPSTESYLKKSQILAAAEITGADAIHPGYGFLSENAQFAEMVEAHGLVFIGPKAEHISVMGDKIASKKFADAANVNTVPGHLGVIADIDEAMKIADEIGYPVMIKASAGGGGENMGRRRNQPSIHRYVHSHAARLSTPSTFVFYSPIPAPPPAGDAPTWSPEDLLSALDQNERRARLDRRTLQ